MKIYCLSTFTNVSDFCGFGVDRIVSNKQAVNDYIIFIKERIISIVSKKPYLRSYPVYISVKTKEPVLNGVYSITHQYDVILSLNMDNSFNQIINVFK